MHQAIIPLRGTIVGRVYIRTRSALILRRFSEVVGYFGQDGQGRGSRAEIAMNGLIIGNTRGCPPRGEENALFACQILVNALRENGRSLNDPQRVPLCDTDVDCMCNQGAVCFQVVQAVVDQTPWMSLNSFRCFDETQSAESIAEKIRSAVQKKSRGLTIASKQMLLLVIDATRFPSFVLTDPVQMFRKRYGQWCAEQGFAEVWLVGPNAALCHRLDNLSRC